MINGNNLRLQFGLESTYGVKPASLPVEIEVASEKFDWMPNKKTEGLLTGNIAESAVKTMSYKTEGGFSTLARPDDLGYILKAAFGAESVELVDGATLAYRHTFTPIASSELVSLPSLYFARYLDASDITGFRGNKINKLSFSGQPEDYLKLNVDTYGIDEVVDDSLSVAAVKSALKSLLFSGMSLSVDGTDIEVTNLSNFSLENGLAHIFTNLSGMRPREHQVGVRKILASIEAIYSASIETLRRAWWKTDELFEFVMSFASEDEIEAGIPYSLGITFPNSQISNYKKNVGGADTIKATMDLTAVPVSGSNLVTVELVNTRGTVY